MLKSANNVINRLLTKRLNQLHNEGYIYDFALNNDKAILCIQNNCRVAKNSFSVKLIDQVYDQLFNNYKYIHTIETDAGEKGILLLPEIYFHKTVN
ncbi:hypothetical protein [Mucilaginibacter sp. KACC 22063]|uniref:hypothetical protein n=1 Tax=Mucilaginibacter sp. KACC 22063 TaxID=3025666 RepID=UPI00236603B0|nr:hypothetical protein [Mucilaginibacter sp. KACC 22063]WDF55644.1 hypothetical protein PQ461_01050 [Mucilaginibacter sp. KACC 22063]